jgi:hypothetical protein
MPLGNAGVRIEELRDRRRRAAASIADLPAGDLLVRAAVAQHGADLHAHGYGGVGQQPVV